jgi:hypothetical protein
VSLGKRGHAEVGVGHQRVTRRGHEGHRVLCEAVGHHVQFIGRLAHDRNVDVLRHQAAHDLVAVGHVQLQLHPRVLVDEGDEQAGQPVFRRADRADPQRAGEGTEEGGHLVTGFVPDGEHPLRMALQQLASLGQPHAAPGAHHELGTRGFFQAGELDGHRRLAQVQFVGRQRDVAQPCNGMEGGHLAEGGGFGEWHGLILGRRGALDKINNFYFCH